MSPAPLRRSARRLVLVSLLLGAFDGPSEAAPPDPAPLPPVIEAPEVTVTATRTEQSVLDVPGNVTVIDRKAIDESGVQTVPDLLRREAGIYVTNVTTDPGTFNVEARGFSNGGGNGCNTLVLVDGKRINEPDTSCPDWSFVSLDEVERIEVIRGPVSAMYGDNGVGGVIHIITRQGRAEPGVRAIARGRSGSYDTYGGSLLLEGAEGPFSATAFVDDDHTDAYRHRAEFKRQKGDLALRYELGSLATLELGGGYASVNRQQPGDLTQDEWDQNPRQAEPGTGDNFDVERQRFVDARLEVKPAEGVTITLLPSYQSTSQQTLLEDPTFDFSNDLDMSVWGVPTQVAWNHTLLGLGNQLLVGADLLREKVNADSLLNSPVFGSSSSASHTRRTIFGVFVNDELWLHENVLVSLGVRRDHSDAKGRNEIETSCPDGKCDFHETHSVWSPRAALTWRVTEPASLYASYARGFRFPNVAETFGFFGFTPGLDPEKSENYEIGAKLRRPGLTANVALYHMNVHDEIFFDPVLAVNSNIDRVRHRGVEVSGSWQPIAWLELRGSYTYDDVEIESDSALEGSTMPITPKHRGDVAATVFLPYGFEIGGNAYYVGSRLLANDVPNTNEKKLGSYATYDLRLGWSHELWPGLRLGLDLTGYNLTDRNYAEFGGVSLALFGPQEVGFFPSPERHYVAAIRLEVRR
ncbi:MAG: TonB-dependent receptor [Myxococcota bacterium]